VTDEQLMKIGTAMKAAYPNANVPGADGLKLWAVLLADFDYKVVENALIEHILTKPFPPTIYEIRKLCVERTQKLALSYGEAWEKVLNAASKYGWYHTEKAYATLDPLTLEVVKELGWENVCYSTNQDTLRANFRMIYEEKAQKANTNTMLSDKIRDKKIALQEQHIKTLNKPPEKVEKIEEKQTATAVPVDLQEKIRMLASAKSMIGDENNG
jgi:hypothetical protein